MATGRRGHDATALSLEEETILITSGHVDGFPFAELFNVKTGQWTTSTMHELHHGATATVLSNGKVLVAGGKNGHANWSTNSEIYDPPSGKWSLANAPQPRGGHTATLLPDSSVLFAGGWLYSHQASAETYNPRLDTWTPTEPMATKRSGHSAVLLANGRVLVAGGHGDGQLIADAEQYDPVSRTWKPSGKMLAPRDNHSATLLPSGHVLFVGGFVGGNALATTELYNPTDGSWTLKSPMQTSRFGHTATLLSNGQVLVAGGNHDIGNPSGEVWLSSVELYDPTSDTWKYTTSMSRERHEHTATLLKSGQVLVVGGDAVQVGRGSTAEVFPR